MPRCPWEQLKNAEMDRNEIAIQKPEIEKRILKYIDKHVYIKTKSIKWENPEYSMRVIASILTKLQKAGKIERYSKTLLRRVD